MWLIIIVLGLVLISEQLYTFQLWRRVNKLEDATTGMDMGSLHWESEVLARLYKEDHPEIEWNRDENGYITGIVHDIEVNFQAVSELGT